MKDLHLRIYENKMYLSKSSSEEGSLLTPARPFSTKNMLVGDLSSAVACLSSGIKMISGKFFFKPLVIVEPMERTENGISESEAIILNMLGYNAGAREVKLIVNGRPVVSPKF